MSKQQTPKQRQYLSTVLELYWQKGMSSEKISRYLGLGHTTVWRWISIFAGENPQTIPDMSKETSTQLPQNIAASNCADAKSPEIQALEREIARLQAELERAEIKAELYNKMIDLAEEKLNIPVRKKYGAKQ